MPRNITSSGLEFERTEHKSLEHYRRAVVERSERLSKITAAIADAVSGEQVFEATVDRVAAAIDASSAALWLVDEHGGSARLVRSIGYEADAREALSRLELGSLSRSPVLDAIVQGQAVFVASQAELLARYPNLEGVATPGRHYRIACLPLAAHGEVFGALGITIEHEGSAAEEEREFLLLVARYASQAIERLRAFEAERKSRAQAEFLYEFAQSVVVAERVEQVFDAALNVIERVTGTERAAILIRDDHGVMRFRAWRRLSETYRAAVEGHSPWSDTAVTFEPLLVPDALSEPTLASYRDLFRSEGIGALAFVPLINSGRLVGKFMIYHDRPHAHAPGEIAICRAIANHVASVAVRFSLIAKLQESIRVSELFAGVLAHDLRNPLGAIMTAAQLVLMRQEGERETTGRNAKPLSRILTSGQRMSRMIDQLLDFTVARTGGGIQIQPRATNLAELCAQAIGELELVHPDWRMETDVIGDQSGTWDPDRLLQIISNLVSNAGQHGEPDEGIRLRLDGAQPDSVCLEVVNRGAIAAPLLPTLFDPFRSTGQRRDQSRGLGLGLFIVRALAEAHGGTVEANSSEELGSTSFVVRLPRHT